MSREEVLNHDRETEFMICKALDVLRSRRRAKILIVAVVLALGLVPPSAEAADYYTYTTLTLGAALDDVSVVSALGESFFNASREDLYVRSYSYRPSVFLRFEGLSVVSGTNVIDQLILSLYTGNYWGDNYTESPYGGGLVSVGAPTFNHNFEVTETEVTEVEHHWQTLVRFDGDLLAQAGKWVNITLASSDPRDWGAQNFNDSIILRLQSFQDDIPDYPYYRSFSSHEGGNPCKLYVRSHSTTLPKAVFDIDNGGWFVEDYRDFSIYGTGSEYEDFSEWSPGETDVPGKGTFVTDYWVRYTNWVTGDGNIEWQNTAPYPGDHNVSGRFNFVYTGHTNTNAIHQIFKFTDGVSNTWGMDCIEAPTGYYDLVLYENDGARSQDSLNDLLEGETYWFRAYEDLAGNDLDAYVFDSLSTFEANVDPIDHLVINNVYLGLDSKAALEVNRPLLVAQAHTQTANLRDMIVTNGVNASGVVFVVLDPDGVYVGNSTTLPGARVLIQNLLASGSYDSFLDRYFVDFVGLFGLACMVFCLPVGGILIKRAEYTSAAGVMFVGLLVGYGLFLFWLAA